MVHKIFVKKTVFTDLALRSSADAFFNHLEILKDKELVLDFKGVKSISRSFAHQYLLRKKTSRKNISEVNVPKTVKLMFKAVENPMKKPHLVDFHAFKVIPIRAAAFA